MDTVKTIEVKVPPIERMERVKKDWWSFPGFKVSKGYCGVVIGVLKDIQKSELGVERSYLEIVWLNFLLNR